MPIRHSCLPLRSRHWLAVLLPSLLLACGEAAPPAGRDMPAPPVETLPLAAQAATRFAEYPARVHALQDVDVRTRVAGTLLRRHYREGARVEPGDLLFSIDPEPYEIALEAARAEQTGAQATLQQAEREWRRLSELLQRNAISAHDVDRAAAERDIARARLERADAALDDARRNLRDTRVEAPIAGIAGLETVPEGTLVEAGTALVRLIRTDPVQLRFALPEQDMTLRRQLSAQPSQNGATPLFGQAWLHLADGALHAAHGDLDYNAAHIDPHTGSVTLRALFPNPDQDLVPGQFLRVRVALEHFEQAILVPPSAVQQGAQGPQVYVVDAEQRAQHRDVRLGALIDGQQLVLDGLQPGDQLVVNGHLDLIDGMRVSVLSAGSTP